LKRLVDAYEVGAIDVEDLKVRSDAVRARIDRAQRELTDAEHRLRETVHLREVVTRLDDFAARVRQGLGKLSWLERRQIIRALVEKIEIDDAAATVVYRLPSSEREPQSPSGSDPQGEGGPKGDRRTSCLLRTHGVGYVTDRGPSGQHRFQSRADRSQSSDDLEESSDHLEKSSDDAQESLAVLMVLTHDRVGLPADIEKSIPVRFCHLADGFRSSDALGESNA